MGVHPQRESKTLSPIDNGRMIFPLMLDARSKEPFAMESLDSEVTMSESFSFETEAQNTQTGQWTADGSKYENKSRELDTLQRSQLSNVSRNDQSFAFALPMQNSSRGTYDDNETSQKVHDLNKGEESKRMELDFHADIEFQENKEETGFQNDVAFQIDVHEQLGASKNHVASDLAETHADSRSLPLDNKKKPAVSAETKARWAMLRSLAGTEKDAVGASDERSERSDSLTFKASVKEELSSTKDQLGKPKEQLAKGRKQVSPRKVDFQLDKKQFALTSRAAVESDMRRSGSGRHQSSRGEHTESESSMSRAASVRRYMEKLRGDPHIDEQHLASVPPVEEVAPREAEISPKGARNLEQSLNATSQREERILSSDAQGFKETLDEMGNGLGRNAQTLTRGAIQDGRVLDKAIGGSAQALGSSLMMAHPLETAANKLGGIYHADKGESIPGAEHLKANLGQRESKLENEAHGIAGALGLDEVKAKLARDQKVLEKDAHHMKNTLGLGSIERTLDKSERVLEQNKDKIEDTLRQEGQELGHGIHEVGTALGFGRIEGVLHREGQALGIDAHKTEAGLKTGERMLGGILKQAASEGEKAVGQSSQSLEHEAKEVKNALGRLGSILPGREIQQQLEQNGEIPLRDTATQGANRPQSSSHQQISQPGMSRKQGSPSTQLRSGPVKMPSSSQSQSTGPRAPSQRPSPDTIKPQHQHLPPQEAQANQQGPTQAHPSNSHPQGNTSQRSPSGPNVSQHQQNPLARGLQSQQEDVKNSQAPPVAHTPQQQQPSAPRRVPAHQQAPTHQPGPANREKSQNVPTALAPQHQRAPPNHSALPAHASSPAPGATSTGPKPQQLQQPQRNPSQTPMQAQHLQQEPLPPTTSSHVNEPPHQSFPSSKDGGMRGAPPAAVSQTSKSVSHPQRSQPQAPHLPQVGLSPPIASKEKSEVNNCNDESHLSTGKCKKEAPCTMNTQNCTNATHLASGACIRNVPCKQKAKSCENVQHLQAGLCKEGHPCVKKEVQASCGEPEHLAAGLCSKAAPCTQKEPQNCQNGKHHAAGTCFKESPCTQTEQQTCCQNLEHHTKGLCSKEAPCTQGQQHSDCCKDSKHHIAGICSKDAPCTQVQKNVNCQDTTHHAVGVCSKESPCTQACNNQSHLVAGTCSRNSPCKEIPDVALNHTQLSHKTKLDSHSMNQSKYCASVEIEETNQTATSSTISMSPQLGPSDQAPPAPSPHVAVFEQLIFGYTRNSQARITAAGGPRGFADRESPDLSHVSSGKVWGANMLAEMTELFVKMAEDALPAIRQRLEENAHY